MPCEAVIQTQPPLVQPPLEYALELLHSRKESDLYNSSLKNAIEKIKSLIIENPHLFESGRDAIRELQHQINTNNHYVSFRRRTEPLLSVRVAVRLNDSEGLKYLLRVGGDPNEWFILGKVRSIEVARRFNYQTCIALLTQHPDFTSI